MYRDILTNKWVLGGVGFLIILAVACVLWYQHDIADDRKAAAEAEELLRQSEIAKSVSDTDSEVEQTANDITTAGSITPTADKPTTKATGAEISTSTDKINNPITAVTAQTDDAKEVRVSPHGFGPYPEIPEGAPIAPFEEGDSRDMELLTRVMVHKWNEGDRFVGGLIENGKVYLAYKDVIYVEYDEDINPETGETTRYISGTMGGGLPITSEQIVSGNLPPGVEIADMHTVGYDPYEILNLP